MAKTQLHKEALVRLIPIFDRFGFEFVGDLANHFRKKIEQDIAQVYFTFKSDNRIYFSKALLSIDEVESIRLSVGLPDMNLKPYLEGKNFLTTVHDTAPFPTDDAFISPIEDKVALLDYAESVERYMAEQGVPFIEKYRNLPSILKGIDALREKGDRWYQLLSKDGSGFFFQGLIISKLCNDPAYDTKVQYVDSVLYNKENGMEDWISNYEKLKEILQTLHGRYQYGG